MRTYQTLVPLLTAAVGFLLSVGIALPSHAQAVDAGYDLFESLPGTSFAGTPMTGVPLSTFNFGGSIGTKNVGNTDTIIQRLSPVTPTGTTTLQMDALSLMTTAPTTFGGLVPLGTYYVFLDPSTPSLGSMTINPTTFDSTLTVNFDIGTAPNDPASVIFSGTDTLNSIGTPWSHVAPDSALLIPNVDYELNGTDTTNDFWPSTPVFETSPGPGSPIHIVEATTTPEPGSIALLTASGVIGLGLLNRKMVIYA